MKAFSTKLVEAVCKEMGSRLPPFPARSLTGKKHRSKWPRPALKTGLTLRGVDLDILTKVSPPSPSRNQMVTARSRGGFYPEDLQEIIDKFVATFIVKKSTDSPAMWLRPHMKLTSSNARWLLPKEDKVQDVWWYYTMLLWWSSNSGLPLTIDGPNITVGFKDMDYGVKDGKILSAYASNRVEVPPKDWDGYLRAPVPGKPSTCDIPFWNLIQRAAHYEENSEAVLQALRILHVRVDTLQDLKLYFYRTTPGALREYGHIKGVRGSRSQLRKTLKGLAVEDYPAKLLRQMLVPAYMSKAKLDILFPMMDESDPCPPISEVYEWIGIAEDFFSTLPKQGNYGNSEQL